MSKAELGVKRRCLSCNKPFFDLSRAPIVCPSCDAVFQAVEIAHSPPRRTMTGFNNKRAVAAPVLADELVSPAAEESAIPPAEEERIAAIV